MNKNEFDLCKRQISSCIEYSRCEYPDVKSVSLLLPISEIEELTRLAEVGFQTETTYYTEVERLRAKVSMLESKLESMSFRKLLLDD